MYKQQYTLSLMAYQHLLEFKIYKRFRPKDTNEWDGYSKLNVSKTYEFSPSTMKMYKYDNPTRGLSHALDVLATTAIEKWEDTRPELLRKADKHVPTEAPPQLLDSHAATNEYKQTYGVPNYQIPFYDLYPDEPRRRYKLTLQLPARDYYYRLARRFNMRPFHQGGRSTMSSYISVALEAIGLEYISLKDEPEQESRIE